MILKFDESSEAFKRVVDGEYKGLDCLNAWYGGRIGRVMKSFGMVIVHFDHIFDSDLIAGAYASQADIEFAEPDYMGDSSDITLCCSSDEGTRRTYVCMHACMYLCMFVCTYACTHMYVHVCMSICVHVCMSICVQACTCLCICPFQLMHICM